MIENIFDNCPNCNYNLNGEDIYEFYLKKYTQDGLPKFARTLNEIIEDRRYFSYLHLDAPSNEELATLNRFELAAWDTASRYGWSFKNRTCFRREIGIQLLNDGFDGVSIFMCPGGLS